MRKLFLVLLSVCLFSGCAMNSKPKLNPLQVQAMQTQDFNASKRKAFDATVTVLQNEGYVIKTANFDTGFVTAQSSTAFKMFHGKTHNTVSAYITSIEKAGKETSRIRLSNVLTQEGVQKTTSFGVGSYISSSSRDTAEDKQVLDPEFYKGMFNKIRQQLFVGNAV